MKQLDKQRQSRPENNASGTNSNDQRRRTKLQPVGKQKYKPKQVYLEDEDDEEIDLFGLNEEDEDYYDEDED
ncbi:hypothetical protein [Lewinella sp. LCG006]|uniref:hypothetical protein n=1 Tax=Lewinella sp. LCG006 TaxID=3231911 RepID=UPI003460480C